MSEIEELRAALSAEKAAHAETVERSQQTYMAWMDAEATIATQAEELTCYRAVAEAARHRGQCHGSICDCDAAIRAALAALGTP